jgi:hypothetical protein
MLRDEIEKINKLNSIQLNDWGIFCNFTRPVWHDQKIDVFSQVQECRSNK